MKKPGQIDAACNEIEHAVVKDHQDQAQAAHLVKEDDTAGRIRFGHGFAPFGALLSGARYILIDNRARALGISQRQHDNVSALLKYLGVLRDLIGIVDIVVFKLLNP